MQESILSLDEGLIQGIFEIGEQVQPKPVFEAQLKDLLKCQGDLPSEILQLIKVLRLTGLLKRKYYQSSVLGKYFRAYKLNCTNYINHIAKHRIGSGKKWIEEKFPSKRISYRDFQQLVVLSSEWYINTMKREFAARRLRLFQEVLFRAFGWSENKLALLEQIQPIINEKLQTMYKQVQVESKGQKYSRYRSLRDPPREPFSLSSTHKVKRGVLLAEIIITIYQWLVSKSKLQDHPDAHLGLLYLDILECAREETQGTRVSVSQYMRTVTWLMETPLTNREKKFLYRYPYLRKLNEISLSAFDAIVYIRKNLRLQKLKFNAPRKRRVLVFTPACESNYSRLAHQAKHLQFTCRSCSYFSELTKIDCVFFKKIEYLEKKSHITREEDIPAPLLPIYGERIQPVSSRHVACLFWAPKSPEIVRLIPPHSREARCVRCYTPLNRLPDPTSSVTCRCKTQYSFFSSEMAQEGKYSCQLSDEYSIIYELDRVDPHLSRLAKQYLFQPTELAPRLDKSQTFLPHPDKPISAILGQPDFVSIKEGVEFTFDEQEQKLTIASKGRPYPLFAPKSYPSNTLSVVDTTLWNGHLQKLADTNASIKFNYRPFGIILSGEDRVTIVKDPIPTLQIKRPLNKPIESYPLHQLQVVYNIGKPRLNAPLKQWDVRVIYYSKKGVLSRPREEVKQALGLPGVRAILQYLHLHGLMISILNATQSLSDLAHIYNVDWLGERYNGRMNRLLPRCPTNLSLLLESQTRSFRQVSRLEAWFSRPFAEGVRRLVRVLQDPHHPMICRPYGRTVARRVQKREKGGADYMGGYTPYDAALNYINQTLRRRLRRLNAKTGLGYKTVPLFVHTAHDRAGISGHLDLEEVGRIISRLVLCETIAKGKLKQYHFIERFDDNHLPYYVPTVKLVTWLRNYLVGQELFSQELLYLDKWMQFSTAHQKHVQHLYQCLIQSLDYQDRRDRLKFLLQTYQPLIFQPKPRDT